MCVCVCLICLHRRNHLTATSRRVKFTSVLNLISILDNKNCEQHELSLVSTDNFFLTK